MISLLSWVGSIALADEGGPIDPDTEAARRPFERGQHLYHEHPSKEAMRTGFVGSVGSDLEARRVDCRMRQWVPADWADLERRLDAGYALLAIGGAAAVADVVLWVLDVKARKRARSAWVAPTGAGVIVRAAL